MWLLYAAGSALCFGLRGILYQWTSQKPIDRNLLLLGVYVSGTLVAWGVNLLVGQSWSAGAWFGMLMGLFSFSANASMYRGFAVGKASLIAILTALPPVVVVGIAFVLWGERLNGWQTVAFAVIVAGILMVRYSNDISLNNLQGAHWGLLAMLMFGLTDLSSKQSTLLGAQTLPTLTVMYATGSVLFLLAWAAARVRKRSELPQPAAGPAEAKAEAEPGAARSVAAGTAAAERGAALSCVAEPRAAGSMADEHTADRVNIAVCSTGRPIEPGVAEYAAAAAERRAALSCVAEPRAEGSMADERGLLGGDLAEAEAASGVTESGNTGFVGIVPGAAQTTADSAESVKSCAAGLAIPLGETRPEIAVGTSGSAALDAKPAPVPWTAMRTLLWGMFVGLTNISGMMFALPAFRIGVTGLVSAVLSINVLIILLYARFVLKEKFSRLEISGILCSIAGILILRLMG